MEKKKYQAVARELTGKNNNHRLRKDGFVPANIIGGGKSIPVSFNKADVNFLVLHGTRKATLIDIDLAGKETMRVFVKDIQRFPGTDEVRHMDLFKITPGKKITTTVSIETTGLPKGAKTGGQFEHLIHEIKVKSMPEDMKDLITIDVTNLDIGDSIRISQMTVPKSWEIITNGDPIVTSVNKTKALMALEKQDAKAPDAKDAKSKPAAGAQKAAAPAAKDSAKKK